MTNPWALFSEVFNVTGPVFAMVVLGMFLKRVSLINDTFISTASTLVFKATMPTLLFIGIMQADLSTAFQPDMVLFFGVSTVLTFALSWLWSLKHVKHDDRGVYVQGAFRGNCGILSLALATNLFGNYGLSVGGVMAGSVIILFNVLSIVVLSIYSTTFKADLRSVVRDMVKNPLILSVVAGLIASAVHLQLPVWIMTSAHYFASLTLPTALICVGGSLSLAAFIDSGRVAVSASLIKILWAPLFFTTLAWLIGFDGRELGLLFLFIAAPTAAASYVMARAAGSDGKLAANIIALTTVISVFTNIIGLYFLTLFGVIELGA